MQRIATTAVLFLAAVFSVYQLADRVSSTQAQQRQTAPGPTIAYYFSPKGGCTEAIVAEIGRARKNIDIQAYSFTSVPIASAVKAAHERGVKVRVVLDKSQRTERYSSATYLHNANVPVWIDAKHAIAHNKLILIDGYTLITGSFNFTKAAEESNAENVLVLKGDAALNSAYADNFEMHLEHSERYAGPER